MKIAGVESNWVVPARRMHTIVHEVVFAAKAPNNCIASATERWEAKAPYAPYTLECASPRPVEVRLSKLILPQPAREGAYVREDAAIVFLH